MYSVIFATGNAEKFEIARAVCEPLGVHLVQKALEIDEIQGEDSEVIVHDKARKAFALVKEPVIVSDDSWIMPGLGGFPGPYMKSMNTWLTPEDFLNLTRMLSDRRAILLQLLVYSDGTQQQLFRNEHVGMLLTESRGSYGAPAHKVITMPGDNGLSIAEAYDRGTIHADRDVAIGWQQFVSWYKQGALV